MGKVIAVVAFCAVIIAAMAWNWPWIIAVTFLLMFAVLCSGNGDE